MNLSFNSFIISNLEYFSHSVSEKDLPLFDAAFTHVVADKEHIEELLEKAFERNIAAFGDIGEHFDALKGYKGKYGFEIHDDYIIVNGSLAIIRGTLREYPFLSSDNTLSVLTLGKNEHYETIDEHLSHSSDDDKIVIGFHWGTVHHKDKWYKYDIPSMYELDEMLGYASKSQGLILACVADSAFHMTMGNSFTKTISYNSPMIWTSNAKNRIKNIGVSGIYLLDKVDMENPVSSLKDIIIGRNYVNKEAYLGPFEWALNTGIPQGLMPLVKKWFRW